MSILPLWIGLLAGNPAIVEAAPVETACEGDTWSFDLPEGEDEAMDDPVVVIFYTTQSGHRLNDDAKEGLKHDAEVGDGGTLLDYIDYVGFANLKQITAPKFLVARIIQHRRKRFKTPVFMDDDYCYSGTGNSAKCSAGERKPYFDPKQTSIAVTYEGKLLKRFDGDVDGERLVTFVRSAAEAAAAGHGYCWAHDHLAY